ncbi:RNA polymerase, sigma-24 subunit, ECF subfamily [Methylocaldum marinum]|uniref:RNA polymerase, sigma-24 subunit, ECF subfamily n=1 Tax=Methylocaldum marinum TaxID=1432792 RepID=A0A250KTF7_9GAMM|nr:sigma-70 family RNA polymerase sigma factor [Methylocaldum marinum]BBA34963.1 RNA polymerase, sigma-24 subunit, ECF subfamily [Methylocaldum marinum]
MPFMFSLSILSLGKLVQDYDSEIRRVLTRRLGCVETVADILQETYRRLAQGELWRQAENPRALMYRIAFNLATDHERRARTESRYLADDAELEDVAGTAPDPERIIESQERLDRLYRAVRNLPPRCRQVFILRKFEDLSQAEISERLEISRSSVEKHLRKALAILRDSLD